MYILWDLFIIVKKTTRKNTLHFLPRYLLLLLLGLIFLPTGCATMREADSRVDLGVTTQTKVYQDQWTIKNPPEVHIRPLNEATYAPHVLFVPFRVTQKMDNPGMVSHAVSRTFFQTWNTMRLFPAMEYSANGVPYRRDLALLEAKRKGADMVVGGFVTYILAGGTASDTHVSVQVEAYDTTSGQAIWSMAQSGLIPAGKEKDFILFATRMRLPTDPVHAICQALAVDMGKEIQNWMAPRPAQTSLDRIDQQIKETIFPKRDAIPSPRGNPSRDEQKDSGESAF